MEGEKNENVSCFDEPIASFEDGIEVPEMVKLARRNGVKVELVGNAWEFALCERAASYYDDFPDDDAPKIVKDMFKRGIMFKKWTARGSIRTETDDIWKQWKHTL